MSRESWHRPSTAIRPRRSPTCWSRRTAVRSGAPLRPPLAWYVAWPYRGFAPGTEYRYIWLHEGEVLGTYQDILVGEAVDFCHRPDYLEAEWPN